jgi:hypothetical protein
MKPGRVDRLLTITFCLDLTLAFWCLSLTYGYHHRMLALLS